LLLALTIATVWIFTNIAIGIYGERKVSAFMQDRLGPMEVGKHGVFQILADILKLMQKEDIVPAVSHKRLFKLAPWLVFLSVFVGFAVIPFSSGNIGSNTDTGVFFLLTIVSLDVFGILLAGWASNNKYSLIGSMRAVAQLLSYEIPMGLAVLCVVVVCQSLNLQNISFGQGLFSPEPIYLFSVKSTGLLLNDVGGFLTWNIVKYPLLLPVFVLFFVASLAESNRAPFDLPEAESELVGGFHTEYSGMRFAIMFLSEYGMMLLLSLLAAVLFLGSWNSPLPNLPSLPLAQWTTGLPGSNIAIFWGIFWLASKAYALVFVQMWVRWTLPRLRVDQLLYLSWKVMMPALLILLLANSLYKLMFI
jgi:NADH-quinone oxidoreductase subunit H